MERKIFKMTLLTAAIIGLAISPVFSQPMFPLFTVNQNDLPEEVVAQLKTDIEKSEITALSLEKNKRDKDMYLIDFSTVEDAKIIIMSPQTDNNVVLTPMLKSVTQFQLEPFFIEEMKQGVLGNFDYYYVAVTAGDYAIKSIKSVSTLNGEVYLPRYFYGEIEAKKEALPKDRQITSITKSKPRAISARPDDPETQKRIAQWEEERSYYIYMFQLPDGTKCTYDENLNPGKPAEEIMQTKEAIPVGIEKKEVKPNKKKAPKQTIIKK